MENVEDELRWRYQQRSQVYTASSALTFEIQPHCLHHLSVSDGCLDSDSQIEASLCFRNYKKKQMFLGLLGLWLGRDQRLICRTMDCRYKFGDGLYPEMTKLCVPK